MMHIIAQLTAQETAIVTNILETIILSKGSTVEQENEENEDDNNQNSHQNNFSESNDSDDEISQKKTSKLKGMKQFQY